MGSSLIMSEYTTLSTYNRSKKGSPSWYGAAVPLALGTSAHACHMVQTYFKTQKPALGPLTSASWQGKEWEDTLGGVAAAPGRAEPHPSPFQQMRARAGEAGGGEGEACHLVLYYCFVFPSWFSLPCYYPWLQDVVFVTKTLSFSP